MMLWFKRRKKKPETTTDRGAEEHKKHPVKSGDQTDEKEVAKPESITAKEEKSESKNRYHVSQNKDESSPHYKTWRVRKEGSDKTIQYFTTQKQAIEDAEKRAKKTGGSIVIHKVDGSIRKQKYS
ncbi:MAG: DUF2188 domain-containing protein [Acholeplasmatales bacterium]|nr:MAG: DUF2188 domain-containing protein [Acholeplasmatales bacterium]